MNVTLRKVNFVLQNVRSMRKNFDTLLSNLNALNLTFDIIFLTEIWISSSEISEYSLDGFTLHANCNDNYRAGGVAIFVNSSLQYCVNTYSLISADVISVSVRYGKISCCFILVYRLLSVSSDVFLRELGDLLTNNTAKRIVILGDMNIDFIKDSPIRDEYLCLCSSFGLDSMHSRVTRPASGSCIDHVFSTTDDGLFSIEVSDFDCDVSDHKLIYVTLNLSNPIKRKNHCKPLYQTKIDYSGLAEALFFNDWSAVLSVGDPNIAYAKFIEIFNYNLNNFKSSIKINRNKLKLKSWMTDSMLSLINHRNKLNKKLAKNSDNLVLKRKVRRLNIKIKLLISRAKERYYKTKFFAAQDLKSKWNVVNNVLGKHVNSVIIPAIEDRESASGFVTDPHRIVNILNNYFINTPRDILRKNQDTARLETTVCHSLINPRVFNSNLFLFPISEMEIINIVGNLKRSNSCGIDCLSSEIVKNTIFSISSVLCAIFNLCLSKGVFPDELKKGVVIPLFKKGSRTACDNYRPISLLNTFSKVFEKLIKSRLINYLDFINFLDKRQYGFIKNSSTEKALLAFLSPLHHHLNENFKVSALFIDISKAFDTVNHTILLTKLYDIGVRGVALNLFESYLRNRMQCVRINNIYSDEKQIDAGVPQGSVLGPLLFLIYLNSIFSLNLIGNIVAFADDMALLYSVADEKTLNVNINHDLRLLKKWFHVHDMILSSKSKIMHFSVNGKIPYTTPFIYHSLTCDDFNCSPHCIPIDVVRSFKYLGVNLDVQLNFKDHVNVLKKKLRNALRTFYYLRNICTVEFLKSIYYALVDSRLRYGLTCWGGIYHTNIKPLLVIQKGILKVINYVPRTTHSFPLFMAHKILPIRYLYVFKVLKVFFIMSGNRVSGIRHVEPYNLRNPIRILIPHPYKEHFKRFFAYTAPKLYSQLPQYIIIAKSASEFCRLLKEWLFTIPDIEILLDIVN